jgi:hypothetical protein
MLLLEKKLQTFESLTDFLVPMMERVEEAMVVRVVRGCWSSLPSSACFTRREKEEELLP